MYVFRLAPWREAKRVSQFSLEPHRRLIEFMYSASRAPRESLFRKSRGTTGNGVSRERWYHTRRLNDWRWFLCPWEMRLCLVPCFLFCLRCEFDACRLLT